MRKCSIVAMFAAAFSLLLVSCFNAGKKQYAAIPAESAMVVKVNLGNVINESEILEVPMVKTALDFFVNSMPKESREMFKEIVAEPSKSGIEVNEPMVLSMESSSVRAVVSMAVSDKNRLVEVIESVAKGSGVELVEKGGVTKIEYAPDANRKEVDIAFNSDILVLAFSERGDADAEHYMNLAPDSQAVNDEKFDSFFENNSDAAWYIDSKPLIEFIRSMNTMNDYERMMLEQYSALDISCLLTLDFENGLMELGGLVFADEEYIKKFKQVWMEPEKKFFEYVPANAIAVYNVASDFGKSLEVYPETMEQILPTLQQFGIDKSMIEALAGDMMFAILPVEVFGNKKVPQVMFAAECAERGMFDAILGILGEEKVSSVEEDVYALGLNRYFDYNSGDYKQGGYDYYLIYKEKSIILLPENVYKEISDGDGLKGLAESVEDNRIFKHFDKPAVVCDASALIGMCKQLSERITKKVEMAFDAFGIVESLEIVVDEPTEVRFRVNMVDKEKNVLKQIVDQVWAVVPSAAMGGF